MKRILCIIALIGIAATAAHSQTATAAFSELTVKDKLTMPRYADTPSYGNRGQLILKYTTDQVYARNGAGTAWILLNGGGGGAAYAFANALTNDGSGNISLGGEMTDNISIPGNGNYYTFGLGTNSNRLGYINQYAAGSIILNTTNAGLNGYIGVYAGSAKLGSFRAGVGVEALVDTFGLKVTRNGSTVAQIRDMPLTTVAYPSVVYDTVSKQFLRSYIAGGGSTYTAGYGMLLSSGAFSTDTTVIASKSRLAAALTSKQDELISGTNIKTLGGHSLLGNGDFEVISPLQTVGGIATQLSINQATTGSDGYLSSTDWNTFNNKKNAADSTTANPANYVTQYQRKKTSDSLAALIGTSKTYGGGVTDSSGKIMLGSSDFFNDIQIFGRGNKKFDVFSISGSTYTSLRVGGDANYQTRMQSIGSTYTNQVSVSSLTSDIVSIGVGKGSYLSLDKGYSIFDNSDSVRLTGGGFTNVGHSLTDTTLNKPVVMSASGRIQKLNYWPAGGGGGSTDTTSLSNRINYKPKVYNVKAYGAVGDSVNDDRTAIQAAINAAADNGGGDVYFPNGKYWLGTGKYTSLASGANPDAQLYLPLGDYARSDTNLSIRFIGESAPNFYANPFDAGHLPITSGVVLASGLTGTGSIIGTDYKFQAWGNFNFNHLILENLTLRANTVGDSTVATAVDGRYMSYLSVKGVRADNKRDQGSTIKPATNSYAIRMPSINNFVFCNVDNFLAYNYGVGIEAGEHSNMDNVFIDGCYIGVKATESNHSMNINRMCIARTAINFVLDTSTSANRIGEITAQQVSVENTTTGGYWFTHVADLIDNSSGRNWVGNIHYNRVLSFGGPNNTTYTIPKTTKVNLIKPSNQYVSTANAVTGITVENTNSGTLAQSNFQAIAGTTGVNFGVSGTGFTPNNIIAADQAYINSSKNLNILMSAGNMKVATVNTNQYETVEFNNPSQYPSLVLNATRAAGTSQNAIQFRKIGVSKFMIGNDLSANNTNDFYIYDYGGAATRLYISSGGSVGIGNTSPTSTLNVTGSVGLSYVSKTSAYTATAADHTIDCTTGTFTVTLPTAVSVTGRMYVVKNSGAGAITVGTTSSQTIDGSTTYSLGTQYKYVHLQSNGANWIVIANN